MKISNSFVQTFLSQTTCMSNKSRACMNLHRRQCNFLVEKEEKREKTNYVKVVFVMV